MSDQLNIKQIFNRAIEIEPLAVRDRYIRNACGNDKQLEIKIRNLLEAHESAGSFLESPAGELEQIENADFGPVESKIGTYEILDLIGQGGFGQVYVARQLEPVRRKVALKLIRPGMGSREVLARFNIERQTLAVMNHPNIARVFDGGTARSGRPYFVMELVSGLPIHKYCQQNELTGRQRLELFRNVCRGVQHAHQKGIIHRDLKPSNILVTDVDDEAVPKVIDFGVAKAITDDSTDETALTRESQFIGTPQYMSPEQASMRSSDIDIRSDIYSLGAILYELLTGSSPIERSQVKQATFDEIRQIICEEDPPKPSLRITNSIQNPEISTAGGSTNGSSRFSRSLRADLDWIVMKALEKDRDRRYRSVTELADDIQRFLNDEPVYARPPSTLYRAKKFVSKNRLLCASTGFVIATLVAATTFSSWQAIRATNAVAAEKEAKFNEAEQKKIAIAKAEEAEKARVQETKKRKQAEAIRDTFISILRSPHPGADGFHVTVREFLDSASDSIPEKFANDQDTKSMLLETLGSTYIGIGLNKKGVDVLEQAMELTPDLEALATREEVENRVETIRRLAHGYLRLDQIENASDAAKLANSIATKRLGANELSTMKTQLLLGDCLQLKQKYDEAFRINESVSEKLGKFTGEQDQQFFDVQARVATGYLAYGQQQTAVSKLKEVLAELSTRFSDSDYQYLYIKTDLAAALARGGIYSEKLEALKTIDEVIEKARSLVGENHVWIVDLKANKAHIAYEQSSFKEAVQLGTEILEYYRNEYGIEHRFYAKNALELVRYYRAENRFDEAKELLDLIAPYAEPNYHESKNAIVEYSRACILLDEGKHTQAEKMLAEILDFFKANDGKTSPNAILAQRSLSRCFVETNQFDKSLNLYEETLDNLIEGHGETHPKIPMVYNNMAHIFKVKKQFREAATHYRSAFEASKMIFGIEAPNTIRALNQMGMAYRDTGQFQKHVQALEQAVELSDKHLPDSEFFGLGVRFNLAAVYRMQGRFKDAVKLLKKVIQSRDKVYQRYQNNVVFTDAVADLAFNYIFLRDRENAPPAFKRMMDMFRVQLKDDRNRFASSLATACGDLNKYGFHDLAEQSLAESIGIREEIMPGNWLIQNSKSILGETVFLKAVKLEEEESESAAECFGRAETLLQESFAGMLERIDTIPEKYRQVRFKEAARRLVRLYRAIDNDEEAKRWQKKLAEIKKGNYES